LEVFKAKGGSEVETKGKQNVSWCSKTLVESQSAPPKIVTKLDKLMADAQKGLPMFLIADEKELSLLNSGEDRV
jgi:hypothetical protein